MSLTPFLDLVDENQLSIVATAFEQTIARSFVDDGSRMTRDEFRRRMEICEKIVRQLRGDLGWGLRRVLDNLPRYLRYELDGISWKPDERTIWTPDDE